MNKFIATTFKVLALAGFLNNSQAAVVQTPNLLIEINNSSTYTTTVGAGFDANIYLNSLSDFGGFDFNVTFDSTKLSVTSLTSAYVFGSDGTEGDPNTTTSPTAIFGNSLDSAGKFHFGETISATSLTALTTSLNVPASPSLLLGTLHFQALAKGTNSLLSIAAATGNTAPLIFGFDPANTYGGNIQTAFVTINAAPAAVPVPSAIWLFCSGLLAMVTGKIRKFGR